MRSLIGVKKKDNRYLVWFNGEKDEFNEYLQRIMQIDNKEFVTKSRAWLIDQSELRQLEYHFGTIENKSPNQTKSLEGYKEMGKHMKLPPFEYQQEAIKFAYDNKNVLIKYPCGSGKTPIGIGIFLELIHNNIVSPPGLIVVKATAKKQWYNEIEKFSDLSPRILRTYDDITYNIRAKIKRLKEDEEDKIQELKKEERKVFREQFKGADVYITNYETLRESAVREQLHKSKLGFIMADEVQYIKNRNAQRSKALYEFSYVPYKVGATATPVKKNSEDIFGLFKFIDPELFPKWSTFSRDFVKYNGYGRVVGSKNLPKLQRAIAPYIISKTKEETSAHLPSLFVMQKYCDLEFEQIEMTQKILDGIEELQEKESSIRANYRTEREAKEDPRVQQIEGQIMALQTFAQEIANSEELLTKSESKMAKDYITGAKSNKIALLIDLLEEIIDSEENVAIYSRFERMQDIITKAIKKNKRLKNIDIAYLKGSMNHKERYRQVYDLFRDNDNYRILLSTDAGADSINLSKCRYVIEMDLADSYLTQTQRHGRIERADSVHDTVFVYQLIARESWDEIQRKIVDKKQSLQEALVD